MLRDDGDLTLAQATADAVLEAVDYLMCAPIYRLGVTMTPGTGLTVG